METVPEQKVLVMNSAKLKRASFNIVTGCRAVIKTEGQHIRPNS